MGLLPDISPFGLFSHCNLEEPMSNWELSIFTMGGRRCYCGGSWPSFCEEVFASGMVVLFCPCSLKLDLFLTSVAFCFRKIL